MICHSSLKLQVCNETTQLGGFQKNFGVVVTASPKSLDESYLVSSNLAEKGKTHVKTMIFIWYLVDVAKILPS